jgi:hypothetical protein
MEKSPASRRMKLIFFITGCLCLFWLPFEDTNLIWVTSLSLLISGLLVSFFVIKIKKASKLTWWVALLCGLIFGVTITLVTFLFIMVKTGIHGHPFPAFSLEQMKTTFYLTPVWILSGTLVMAGLYLQDPRK